MEIHDILRAQYVKRWTIVHTIKQQSLAEHTFNVTMIARAICKRAGLDDVNVMKACLAHDLDEILTGDIPSPTKREAKERGWDLNNIYVRVTSRELTPVEESIVKIADLMEAVLFIDENGVGRHAEKAEEYLISMFKEQLDKLPDEIRLACADVMRTLDNGDFQL